MTITSLIIAAVVAMSLEPEPSFICEPYIDFSNDGERQRWRVVNDGVMGGLSSGALQFEKGAMIYEGTINTNGGGFSSIRRSVDKGALKDVVALRFVLKSDGRQYKVSMRSSARVRGRRVAFQAPIEAENTNEWAEATAGFDQLKGSIFGRPIANAVFESAQATQIGIILADGMDGPFRVEIKSIDLCRIGEEKRN